MVDKVPASVDLTIHLIKSDWEEINSILDSSEQLTEHAIQFRSSLRGHLFVKRPRARPPKWGRFFADYIDLSHFGRGASPAAVLLLELNGRWFAITFGPAGRFLIDQDCTEERFGLLVVLNSIPENRVRSIDKTAFDARGTHSRVQTNQEATPQDFGLDIERDLLRAVTGTPNDEKLGQRLHGMDALRATVRITLDQLPDLLSEYYRRHHSKIYKKSFSWVDHIAEVKDNTLKNKLDELLVERIHKEEFEQCWMAIPEIVDWSLFTRFRYGHRRRNARHHDIHLPIFLRELAEITKRKFSPSAVDLELLQSKRVLCIGDDDLPRHVWSVYKCLYCELDYNRNSYLLSSGKWYRVQKDFVQEVDEYFQRIPRYEGALPEYTDESETQYNERIARENAQTYALMDRKNIPYAARPNAVEFCDLYSRDRDIIHVKRYGGSSVLSHLFAQGTVSGELFRVQPEFRELVNDRLPDSHKIENSQRAPERDEYQVVFAIVSDQAGDDLTLPFFSRLNVRSAVSRLVAFGYRAAIAKIPVDQTLAMRREY